MRYLILLYGREDEAQDPGSPEFAAELAGYERFDAAAGAAIVAGEALEPSRAGSTLRHEPGGPLVSDGVFAETTDVIGGFYVLDVEDLDRAIDLARRIPAAASGAVELRPLVEWSQAEQPAAPAGPRYVALLAGEESEADHPGTPAWDAAVEAHARFARSAGEHVLGGGALHPAESGTVVRSRGGEVLVTDGVYAEATEIVGGLYLLWAGGRDEAIDLAGRIPMEPGGIVWLRPVMELGA